MSDKKKTGYVPYEERLSIIMSFLGISKSAATFIYHRKRRGYPFKKKGDSKYLEWTLQLQNALVKADECIGWDWDEIRFGDEAKTLSKYDIILNEQSSKETFKNEKPEDDNDGWTVVKNTKKIKHRQMRSLQIMRFLPRPQEARRFSKKKFQKHPKHK